MADLQKRSSYTPRSVRERRAYRLVLTGSGAGLIGVLGVVLAIVGTVGAWLPIIAFLVAAVCVVLFRRVVSG